MHLLGAWARPRGSAVLWHLHDYAGRRPFTARLLRRYAHRCSAVVANSQSVADDVRQVCGDAVADSSGLERRRSRTLLAGRAAARSRRRCPDCLPLMDVLRVGLVATFARWKGHETFLRRWRRCPRRCPCAATSSADRCTRRRAARSRSTSCASSWRALGLESRRRIHRLRAGLRDGHARARHRRARQHRPRTIRTRDRRGDGLRQAGRRQPRRRRGRS